MDKVYLVLFDFFLLLFWWQYLDPFTEMVTHIDTETPRDFFLTLETSIKNCKTESSICETYRSYVADVKTIVRYNCENFAVAAYFHTTSPHHVSCGVGDRSFLTKDTIESNAPTENIYKFGNELSSPLMNNKMCLVWLIPDDIYHVLALEIRQNAFYIYNSWENMFSNSWFSGLNDTADFMSDDVTDEKCSSALKNSFIDYKKKCGLGIGLTKFGLNNCFIHLKSIAKIIKPNSEVNFNYNCKNLIQEFKDLKQTN